MSFPDLCVKLRQVAATSISWLDPISCYGIWTVYAKFHFYGSKNPSSIIPFSAKVSV
jgi:hypothetical protein